MEILISEFSDGGGLNKPFSPESKPLVGSSSPTVTESFTSSPFSAVNESTAGSKSSFPAILKATTVSGEVTKANVEAYPSFLFGKLRL